MNPIIYQGETTTIKIRPKVDGNFYTLTNNDLIIFGMKTNVKDKKFVIKKILNSSNYNSASNSYIFTLSASETASIAAATYIFDIGLQLGNGDSANYYYIKKPDFIDVVGTVTKKQES